jgi:hypothetical protein
VSAIVKRDPLCGHRTESGASQTGAPILSELDPQIVKETSQPAIFKQQAQNLYGKQFASQSQRAHAVALHYSVSSSCPVIPSKIEESLSFFLQHR